MSSSNWGLVEQIAAAARTGRISEKALNAVRKGGVINQIAEQLEDGVLTDADLKRFLASRRVAVASELRPVVFPPLTPDQERVKALLGDGFVSPERYAQALRLLVGIKDADLAKLAVIPWTDEELAEEIALGAILYPHVEGITLPFLRKTFGTNPRRQPCFYKNNDWWQDITHKDLRDKTIQTGWRLVRTHVEPNSTSITWDAQSALVPETHDRTWTLEVVEMCLLSYRLFKTRPLENMYAWCKDVVGDGHRADAGAFGRGGLRLGGDHPDNAWSFFGLVLSRKVS